MKAFVTAGSAIILTLILTSFYAQYCTSCCNNRPCNPELYAKLYPAEVAEIRQGKEGR